MGPSYVDESGERLWSMIYDLRSIAFLVFFNSLNMPESTPCRQHSAKHCLYHDTEEVILTNHHTFACTACTG